VDYVRLRIACRDISKVPKTAEGVLGLTLYDFGFESEILEASYEKTLKSGIKVTIDQPPSKKPRADTYLDSTKSSKPLGTISIHETTQEKYRGKQVMTSAPPKMQQAISGGKLMKDAQKAYTKQDDSEMQDKVFIPENIEESDSESDSFGERLRKLNEDGQSSMQDGQREHLWFVNVEPNGNEKLADTPQETVHPEKLDKCNQSEMPPGGKISESPEVFIPDDNII
jgi:hypothetical protein